jgi:hypothetical protein
MFLPVQLLVVRNQGPVELACTLCMACSLITAILYFWRIAKRRWGNTLLEYTPPQRTESE